MASIKKNLFYSGLLTAANYVFPLITYPYVARVIGVDNIGAVGFVDSVVNYFVIISMMGMSVLGVREVASAAADKDDLSRRLSALLSLNAGTTVVALVIYAAVCMLVPSLREHGHLMAFGALKIAFSALLVEWLYRGLEDFRYITVRTVAVKAAYVAAVFALVRNADDYDVYYLLTVMAIGVNSIVNIWHSRGLMLHLALPPRQLMRRYALPMLTLGAYAMLTAMYTTLNVSFLGFACGDREVGFYNTALKFFTILMGFYSAFTGVMMPRLSALLSAGQHEVFHGHIRRSVAVLVSAAVPMSIACMIFAPDIVWAIAGPGYEGAITPLRIIVPLIFVVGYEQILVVQMLMPAGCDKVVLRNALAGAALSIALNALAVKHGMATATAAVWVACEICVMMLSQRAVSQRFGIKFPWRSLLGAVMRYAPLGIVLVAVAFFPASSMLHLVACALLTALYYVSIEWRRTFFLTNKGW